MVTIEEWARMNLAHIEKCNAESRLERGVMNKSEAKNQKVTYYRREWVLFTPSKVISAEMDWHISKKGFMDEMSHLDVSQWGPWEQKDFEIEKTD